MRAANINLHSAQWGEEAEASPRADQLALDAQAEALRHQKEMSKLQVPARLPAHGGEFSKLAIGSLTGAGTAKESIPFLLSKEEQHAAVAALRRCSPVLGIMMAPSRFVGFRRSTGRVAARRA